MIYKPMYKYELAEKAGVSIKTLRKWIKEHQSELKEFGYKKHDKILSSKTVAYLCDFYTIIVQDS